MPTEVKAFVTQAVAEKIYGNYLKGNPPFKPWKGMEQCAWFAYDGDPNAGDLLGQGKTILVKCTANIPAGAPTISGKELEAWHDGRTKEGAAYKDAEGQMWHRFVGGKGKTAVGGMLIVAVGKTRFSSTDGKYLLVNNHGLDRLTLTQTQAQQLAALISQNDPQRSQTLSARLTENTQTHGTSFYVYYPSGVAKNDEATNAFRDKYIVAGQKSQPVSIVREPSVFNAKKRLRTSVYWTVTYASYHEAKREARRIHSQQWSAPGQLPNNLKVEWAGDNKDRWKYKDSRDAPTYGRYSY